MAYNVFGSPGDTAKPSHFNFCKKETKGGKTDHLLYIDLKLFYMIFSLQIYLPQFNFPRIKIFET